MGAMRTLIAEVLGLSDDAMMKLDIPNGRAFQFDGKPDPAGHWHFTEVTLPDHLLTADAETVSKPPKAPAARQPQALTRDGPGLR
jgi:hypothetical protein